MSSGRASGVFAATATQTASSSVSPLKSCCFHDGRSLRDRHERDRERNPVRDPRDRCRTRTGAIMEARDTVTCPASSRASRVTSGVRRAGCRRGGGSPRRTRGSWQGRRGRCSIPTRRPGAHRRSRVVIPLCGAAATNSVTTTLAPGASVDVLVTCSSGPTVPANINLMFGVDVTNALAECGVSRPGLFRRDCLRSCDGGIMRQPARLGNDEPSQTR